jgi:hypothetical protein
MPPDRDKPRGRPTMPPTWLDRADADLAPLAEDTDPEDGDAGLVDLTPERFRELISAAPFAESPPPVPVQSTRPSCAA